MSVPGHWRALLRLAMASGRRRPAQTALLVLGVALGVAVGTAIDVANGSAMAAFRRSTEAVVGRSTHRLVGGPTGLDENVYAGLRGRSGMPAMAPVVEGPVEIPVLGETFTLLGVDPFADGLVRGDLAVGGEGTDAASAALIATPGAVLMARDPAARAGIALGDAFTMSTGSSNHEAVLVAYLEPTGELDRRAADTLLVADIATGQEILGRIGRLDRIDLVAPSGAPDAEEALRGLRDSLPRSAALVPASEQMASVEAMTEAFRLNLTALSLMALVVGVFLVFNTVRFGVVQRRRTIGTLRAMGVTRREVFGMVLAEAALFGFAGSLLGLLAGVMLARGAVELVSTTINELFLTVPMRGADVSASTLLQGLLLGVCAACAAALGPAYEATSISPVAAMRRSQDEAGARRAAPKLLALALGAAGLGLLALLAPGERVGLGFVGLAAIVLAFALAAPAATMASMAVAGPPSGRAFGVVGRMAPRSVSRSLSRTAVAVGALALAVSVSIGVQLMVDSFRSTVETWLESTLQADVFVTQRSLSGPSASDGLSPETVRRIVASPGVTSWSTAHEVTVRSPDLGAVDVVALTRDLAGEDRSYLEAVGDPEAVWHEVQAGAVVVSEPFARSHDLRVGETVTLQTDREVRSYPVAGVYRDYASTTGTVLMDDAVYRDGWDDERVTSVALLLEPGRDPDAAVEALRGAAAGEGLAVRSNAGLRAAALAVFDQAFAITGALRLLAIVVAFMGMLSALLALQLERAREHGTLRATGLTQRQLGALSMLESGLVGAVAGLLAWPAGLALALVLIHVINRRSFGWTIETSLSPWPFAAALALAVGSAVLAGAYPAVRLARQPIARSLREE